MTAVQAGMNVAASLGACSAPLIIGGLTRANQQQGWRNFYVRSPLPPVSSHLALIQLSVDPDGDLGSYRDGDFFWLYTTQPTHAAGSYVFLAEAWSA